MTSKARDVRPLTTHKRRSVWYRETSAWPFREPTAEQLARGLDPGNRPRSVANPPRWTSMGPTNMAGRMTCAVADPRNPKLILAGAAGGGVWKGKESNRGDWTWQLASKGLGSLNVGSLALDARVPAQPVVYCGTGEANLSADSHPGLGLFKSDDWGDSWSLVASPTGHGIPGRIGAVAVDPTDSDHILLGGVGHRSDRGDSSGGLYRSTDGGANWSKVDQISPAPYWCHDVVFDQKPPHTAYATVTARGALNGIWRLDRATGDWTHLLDGLPPPETIQRTSVATAPSEAGWVYALAADRYGGVLGVYQSWDKGTTWREIGHGHFAGEKYLNNANSIAVDPSDPYRVICGGVDLHLWEGGRWSQATFWRSKSEDWEYAHADHRGLLWPQTKRLYDLNDGGVALSTDGGWSWEDRTEGLVNTMFYDLDVAPGDPQGQAMGGGTQDQGTLVTVDGPAWFEDVTGGDGGWMAFDHKEKKRFYATVYEGAVYFHDSFDNTWSEDASPPEEDWIKASLFLSPLRIHPDRERPETVYYGTTRIWQSKPAPRQRTSWHRLSEDLDGSPVTALEVASNSAYLYAGTQNGGVFASQDHGASWSGDLSSRVLPGALITRIRAHPKKPLHVLLCVGLFGHPHVFRSIDGGETWKPVSQSLPDIPFRALAIDPENPDVVYAGSDAGIFVSRDFGNSWKTFIGDLPGVMVTDLVIHSDGATPPVRHLYASTFGRGIWRTPIP